MSNLRSNSAEANSGRSHSPAGMHPCDLRASSLNPNLLCGMGGDVRSLWQQRPPASPAPHTFPPRRASTSGMTSDGAQGGVGGGDASGDGTSGALAALHFTPLPQVPLQCIPVRSSRRDAWLRHPQLRAQCGQPQCRPLLHPDSRPALHLRHLDCGTFWLVVGIRNASSRRPVSHREGSVTVAQAWWVAFRGCMERWGALSCGNGGGAGAGLPRQGAGEEAGTHCGQRCRQQRGQWGGGAAPRRQRGLRAGGPGAQHDGPHALQQRGAPPRGWRHRQAGTFACGSSPQVMRSCRCTALNQSCLQQEESRQCSSSAQQDMLRRLVGRSSSAAPALRKSAGCYSWTP